MVKKYLVTFITCMILVVMAVAQAQEKPASTEFGNVVISVGQPKDEAISRLSLIYNVNKIMSDNPDEELWSVTTKQGVPFQTVGTITIKNHKIVRIQKNWGTFRDLDQTRALIQAMRSITKEGSYRATLIISKKEEAGKQRETITMYFADRKLVISIIEFPGIASGVIMYELLDEADTSKQFLTF